MQPDPSARRSPLAPRKQAIALAALATLACLATVLALPTRALAQDRWTTPFPGVRRLHRTGSSQNINALMVDLCAPGVSLRVTAPAERARTPSSFGTLVGAEAAINGGFYNTRDLSMTDGYVLHDGAAWGGTDHGYTGPAAFGDNRVEILPHEAVGGPAPWMREAVEGHPTLVHNGVARDNRGDTSLCPRNPRTAVGLTADRRTLILVVVDGRASTRLGMTCNELAALMQDLGAHWALNLDGGGSSAMWLAGTGVVNNPSDGAQRTVSNHLALYASGTGAAPHCPPPAYRATYVTQTFPLASTTLDLAPGATFDGYIEMRNDGTAPWSTGRTFLGTTEPRDRASPVAGPGWIGPNRPATIDRNVPPGMTGRFAFTLRAPDAPGEYREYFGVVQEGVAWFSDPAQGGPRDNLLQVRVRTVAALADAGATTDAGTAGDSGTARDAGGAMDAGEARDARAPGDDAASDSAASDSAAGDGGPAGGVGGCGCRTGAASAAHRGLALALMALALGARRRTRRSSAGERPRRVASAL